MALHGRGEDIQQDRESRRDWFLWWGLAALSIVVLGYSFSDSLANLVHHWQTEEYSHGYIIPIVSLLLAWHKRHQLSGLDLRGSWAGVLVVGGGLALYLLGEHGNIFSFKNYALLITITGLVITAFGWHGLRVLWAPLFFLIFMIPLPSFFQAPLSMHLQLISSEWGVAIIRLFGISVFQDGNIIDLGSYKLQVDEACSGLRYLFPLMSFGFICAYMTRLARWQKVVVFLSTIPLTIIMNSVRIAVVGILVEFYGIEMAQGFYHDFEGWAIFIACIAVLFAEIWLLAFFFGPKQEFRELVSSEFVPERKNRTAPPAPTSAAPATAYASMAIILLVAVASNTLAAQRAEAVPERVPFATFPLAIESWDGSRTFVLASIINALKVDDFIAANYRRPEDEHAVNLYVAYRASLRKRPFAHSPQNCLPGGGWQIASIEDRVIEIPSAGLTNFRVKSVIINKGDERHLVYYWFQHRDRHLTGNLSVKWYLFWDSLTQNRSDGSLIRLITKIDGVESVANAEKRLIEFLGAVRPELARYLPG